MKAITFNGERNHQVNPSGSKSTTGVRFEKDGYTYSWAMSVYEDANGEYIDFKNTRFPNLGKHYLA